jgi:phosphocarrier protein FPr
VTVGLVVVSHSHALAEAAIALASEMLHGQEVTIQAAAGLDENTFGTDAVRIKEAIERADGPGGVVVLMDMGSAVLSTELALDLLADPEVRGRVTLSPAPVVEGLVVAAVAAAGGASRQEIAAEAAEALLGKSAQLTEEPSAAASGDEATADALGVFTVKNAHGLHARPAARLVGAVRDLDAVVRLRNLTTGAGPVPATSLSRVASLAALLDHEVEVQASGPQAREAVDQLVLLADRRFDEVDVAPSARDSPTLTGTRTSADEESGSTALPASPGVVVGKVSRAEQPVIDPADVDYDQADPKTESRRLVEAVADVRRQLESVRLRTQREVGAAEAGIFDAHLAMLSDSQLLTQVREQIDAGASAPTAWGACLADVEREWAQIEDPYLRERSADVAAVAQHVLRALVGHTEQRPAEGVLVLGDLTPAQAADLDGELVHAVVLAHGSASSHAAILARARGIPMIVGAGPGVLRVDDAAPIVLDGSTGEFHVDPSPEQVEEFQRRADELAARRDRELAAAGSPAVSLDGVHVDVLANVGSPQDARAAFAAGADGIGLVRTEFLFLGRDLAPDLAEQHETYAAISAAMAGRRVVFRTLDVGGDKPLPYLQVPLEDNPFLGLRGIRLSLDRPELLGEQLRALCQTAGSSPVSVMFPMVATLQEFSAALDMVHEASAAVGSPYVPRVGMMVEVPAAALRIEAFLPHLDFVSIGTNDLTQYTLAAERGNPAVAALTDALDPAVLQLIDRVSRAAGDTVDVAVCGEVAADPLAIPVLMGLGVRELSVSPRAVPGVKAAIRTLDLDACRDLASRSLTLASAQDVRALVLRMPQTTEDNGRNAGAAQPE